MAERTAGAPAAATSDGRLQHLNQTIARRYGSITIPPAALLLAVIGVGILAAPHRYTSGSYQLAFRLVPARVGGLIFLAAGTAALLRPRHHWAVAALVAVHVTWALIVAAAVFTETGVPPTAPAYPVAVAVVLFQAVAGTGYRP